MILEKLGVLIYSKQTNVKNYSLSLWLKLQQTGVYIPTQWWEMNWLRSLQVLHKVFKRELQIQSSRGERNESKVGLEEFGAMQVWCYLQ